MALTAGKLAREKKAYEIRILDLRKLSPVSDFFVVCSVDADVQARAVTDHIVTSLREMGHKPYQTEGYRGSGWILLDFVDVVVHIFLPRVREFYSLERLWGDAPVKELDDD